jgi:hypothetical protein
MKRVLLLSALFGLHIVLKAQKVYFIYLQSETSAPFYIKMAGKIQSSTTEGYLIIPKLTDSTYLVAIGQPGKPGEPKFSITINRGDRGFLIKDFDGTPGLFDLQTLAVYKPITVEPPTTPQTVAKNDNFTKLLAKAADDTTLLSEPVVMQEQKIKTKEPKTEVVAVKEVVPAKDTSIQTETTIQQPSSATLVTDNVSSGVDQKDTVTVNTPQVSIEPVKDVVINKKEETAPAIKEEYQRSLITKKPGGYTPDGVGFVFFDNYNGKVDTIQLVIPNPNPNITTSETVEKQATETRQFLEMSDKKEDASKQDASELKTVESSKAKLKPQCGTLSTDDDFFKLRKDMVSKKSDDEMIAQAKKYFRAKCFRTEQIKYLSSLFLSDEGKYQFFDAAYLHVSDQERFGSLQSELKDSYYINRFKALLGN